MSDEVTDSADKLWSSWRQWRRW